MKESCIHKKYLSLIEALETKKMNGVIALIFYLFTLILWFFTGAIKVLNVPILLLQFSDIIASLIEVLIIFGILYHGRERLNSLGLTKENICKSAILGILGGFLLIALTMIKNLNGNAFTLYPLPVAGLILFIICAICEEIVYRGYLTTRLNSLTKNMYISSMITAFLFVLSHYPAKWGISGTISFTDLTLFHIVMIVLLHFLCDFVYKKTNCIWGAAILHIVYNIGTSVIIFG